MSTLRRIVGVPKPESNTTLNFLFHQVAEDVDFQVRFHWEPNSVAFWDNKVSSVSAQRRA
jgi:sulfonate dioxygenase